ncbi:MAG: biotin/lipoyl-binding protein, partial [Rhodobacteraceae bacterium]|nr:biotin/lipoyl-binding protein [Paracoccaceae bacterium]
MGVFAMPSLGADMEAGTLVEWLVKPGDTVKRGDVVAVVETQKGAIEIECFEVGTVTELTAELGQELPVGAQRGHGEHAHRLAPQRGLGRLHNA